MAGETALSNPRVFYGWLVVAGAFTVTFVGFGSAYTPSAPSSNPSSATSAARAARCRWCSRSPVFSISASAVISGPLADRFGSAPARGRPA